MNPAQPPNPELAGVRATKIRPSPDGSARDDGQETAQDDPRHVSPLVPGGTPEISVVIPAYNEADRIGKTLRETSTFLASLVSSYEIIVVDDGSEDSTGAVVREFSESDPTAALMCLGSNLGKGAAVRAGVARARGRYIVYLDADGASRIDHMTKLIGAVRSGADVAIGSRISRGKSDVKVTKHWYRHLMGQVFNRIVRTVAVPGIYDTQCGFKLFRHDAAKQVFNLQKINGFAFDVEILYLCRQHGFRIVEIPVDWTDIPGSRVRVTREPFRMLLDVFRIRRRHR